MTTIPVDDIPKDDEGRMRLRQDPESVSRVREGGRKWLRAWKIRADEVKERLDSPVSDEADDLVSALEVRQRLARRSGEAIPLEDAMREDGFDPVKDFSEDE